MNFKISVAELIDRLTVDNIKQFKKSLGKDLATLNLGGWTQGLA